MSLDDALAGWAAAVRLPAATAEDIFQRIVAAPVPASAPARVPAPAALEPAWWRRYTSDFTARMVASTRPVPWAA